MLLLYCVTESALKTAKMLGVHDKPVSAISSGGALCHLSDWSERNKDDAQQDALAYWSVVNRLFQQNTVIPFRFPTFMKDQAAAEEFMSLNAAAFLSELHRLRGLVQMKLVVPQETASIAAPPRSGTEFLKQRQQSSRLADGAVAALTFAGEGIVREWKQSHRGGSTLRFALMDRNAISDFKSRISAFEAGSNMRISGPWPPSEFIKCDLVLPPNAETKLAI